jgi:hypothetical protein
MAETVHLYFRSSGGIQHLPGQLITPAGAPSTQFTEVSGLTIETVIGRSRKFAFRAPLSRQAVSAMPILQAQLASKEPILMALSTFGFIDVTGAFRSVWVSKIEDHGSSFMVEISGVNAGY